MDFSNWKHTRLPGTKYPAVPFRQPIICLCHGSQGNELWTLLASWVSPLPSMFDSSLLVGHSLWLISIQTLHTQLYKNECAQTSHQSSFQLALLSSEEEARRLQTPALSRGLALRVLLERRDPLGTGPLKTFPGRGTCSWETSFFLASACESCCFSYKPGDASSTPAFQWSLFSDNFISVPNKFRLFPALHPQFPSPINPTSSPTSPFLKSTPEIPWQVCLLGVIPLVTHCLGVYCRGHDCPICHDICNRCLCYLSTSGFYWRRTRRGLSRGSFIFLQKV